MFSDPINFFDPDGRLAFLAAIPAFVGSAEGAAILSVVTTQLARIGIGVAGAAAIGVLSENVNDNGKNEKHGDSGRAKKKIEQQIEALKDKLAGATGREKTKIKNKIKKIEEDARRKAKGEEHGRRCKKG